MTCDSQKREGGRERVESDLNGNNDINRMFAFVLPVDARHEVRDRNR